MAYGNSSSPSAVPSVQPPSDKNVIWLDKGTGRSIPKIWDDIHSVWMPINTNNIEDSEVMEQLQALKKEINLDLSRIMNEITSMTDWEELNTISSIVNNLNDRINLGEGNYYTRNEIDQILSYLTTLTYVTDRLKAKADLGSSYTKNEEDSFLSLKADKEELASNLQTKANALDVYTKDEVKILVQSAVNEDVNFEADLSMYLTKSQIEEKYQPLVDLSMFAKTTDVFKELDNFKLDVNFMEEDLRNQLTSINTILSNKADNNSIYSRAEIENLFSKKADVTLLDAYVNNVTLTGILHDLHTTINLKSNISDVYGKLNVDSLLSNKMDVVDLSIFAKRTDLDDVKKQISLKSNSSDVHSKLEVLDFLKMKLDKTELDKMLLNYYTGTIIEDKLSIKANSSNVYSKTENDTLLNEKVNKSSLNSYYLKTETYNKVEIDSQLSTKVATSALESRLLLKANIIDVYTKTETYSKTELNDRLSNKADSLHTHSDLHSPFLIGTKMINESKIANNRILAFNAATGKIEYANIEFKNLLGIGTIVFNFL